MTARQKNLRALIAQWGGGEALAKKLGYANPSYLSQMSTGYRPISEKTARKLEAKLALPVGWLDREHATESPKPPQPEKVDASLFAKVVVLVGAQMSEQGVQLTVAKFEEVVAFVYELAANTGKADEALVRRVLKMAVS